VSVLGLVEAQVLGLAPMGLSLAQPHSGRWLQSDLSRQGVLPRRSVALAAGSMPAMGGEEFRARPPAGCWLFVVDPAVSPEGTSGVLQASKSP
jgi:hypothetical protein